MKVAMVNTALTKGGAARVASTLTRALNVRGNVTATLFHCEDSVTRLHSQGLKRPLSRPINALLSRLGGSTAVNDFGVAREIAVASSQFDVVHLHNLHGYYLDYAKLFAELRHVPLVWTWHDMWPATGRCGFSDGCELWANGCPQCPKLELYPSAWVDNAAKEFAAKSQLFLNLPNLWVIAQSSWLGDIAVRRGFPAERVLVVPNPTDFALSGDVSPEQARRELNLPASKYLALFVAADCADPRKGFADFVEAVQQSGAFGAAVGKPALQSPGVLNVGPITDRQLLAKYYLAADILLVPSRSDNYPNTIVESMTAGTPVIAYSEGGIPSQLADSSGVLVPPGSRTHLVQSLTAAMRLGRKSPESVALTRTCAGKWQADRVAEQYEAVYARAMRANSSGVQDAPGRP